MRFVRSSPNEFLVVGRRGRVTNRGTAASAILWPGWSAVTIPSTKQESCFQMTQESMDGIPLRFKGIVIYRVVDPVTAARLFDFAAGTGHRELKEMMAHVCLGELRSTVSHLTMQECIEQRKTTLTDAVWSALRELTRPNGDGGEAGWGIELDIVQVAQVFIVDQELRRQLEAEVRNEVASSSALSDIAMQRRIKAAEMAAEQDHIETEAPVQLLRMEKEREAAQQQLENLRLETALEALQVEKEMLRPSAQQALRKEMMPLEQVPALAEALSRVFQGTSLTLYGSDTEVLASLAPLVDLVSYALRRVGGSGAGETD